MSRPAAARRAPRLALLSLAAALAVALAAPGPARADEGPSAWLYDPRSVVEMDLAFAPEARQALEEDPGEYQPATLTVRAPGRPEQTVKAEARLKGSASFRTLDGKAAFKVKLSKAEALSGIRRLTLNNMVEDPSMLHEALAYEAFRAVGLPAARTGYVRLTVDGVLYGVYANVETYDDIWLPRWFASTRHLLEGEYEWIDGALVGADVLPERIGMFEVDEGDEEDLSDLEALVAAAGSEGPGSWWEAMAPVADLEQMARYWAVERYVGQWDGYAGRGGVPNNYYLHSDDAGRFTMLPWGLDLSWTARLRFDEPGNGLLFNRCLADPACRDAYERAVEEVAERIASLGLAEKGAEIAAMLAPIQAEEDPVRRESTEEEIRAAVEETLLFIAERPGEVPRRGAEPPDGEADVPPEARRGPLRAQLGPARLRGRVVSAPVAADPAGRAVLIVERRRGRAWKRVCRATAILADRGHAQLSCRLGAGAARVLRFRGRRAVRVRVGFVAADGRRAFDVIPVRLR